MKTYVSLFLFLLGSLGLCAQAKPILGKWWVDFTDKNDSPFCTCRPAEFLSARSLERRARAGIATVENDLPVNPAYVRALKDQGVQLHHTSRWLNAATVVADSAAAQRLRQLPFVKKVEYVGRDIRIKNPPNRPPKKRVPLAEQPAAGDGSSLFGYAGLQNNLLGVPPLYAAGHRGAGIWVAVMDGGFVNVDTLPFFDSVAVHHRLFQGHDFVERDGAVFESAMHGTSVLSVMAANLPGFFIGTAPEATYLLLKTEDTGGEFPVEECNWIAGAEWADSVGADIINASLGYTSFNDTTLSHHFAQLDGRTTIASRGATIAASKGMIICNSAGNSGDEPWRYLGVPADAAGVLAVGAVDSEAKHATFSSHGPTADGRIKPDLVAPGDQVVVAGNTGTELGLSSGTSLAAPMLSGALASLWSAYPEKTASEILEAVFSSADQADGPDSLRGYGLPNMAAAWLSLGGYRVGDVPNNARNGFFSFQREAGTLSFLLFANDIPATVRFELRNALGESLGLPKDPMFHKNQISSVVFQGLFDLPPGAYQVLMHTSTETQRLAFLTW
ncbi:MAG: S8 family serine peptidase [Saprospiraceae bacterium]|nr:S8 family serine peptidase [Saprospiraceae bacterium]